LLLRENRSPKSGQITETMKTLPTMNPTKRQIMATFTTVASEQIILIEKFTFSF
jgi:hypothetical protein